MKKLTLILLTIGAVILGSLGTSSAITTGEFQKCGGLLHACFQTGHLDETLADILGGAVPSSVRQCEQACGPAERFETAACDFDQCVSRCVVWYANGEFCE